MSRARILAATIARLEAERWAPRPPHPAPRPWTAAEQESNRRQLLEALDDDTRRTG